MGVKASDFSICFGCSACHEYLDRGLWLGEMSEADVLRTIIRGLQETWEILIRDNVIGFPLDNQKAFHERKVRPRKPKEQRTKVAPGRKLESRSEWPKGRKIPARVK